MGNPVKGTRSSISPNKNPLLKRKKKKHKPPKLFEVSYVTITFSEASNFSLLFGDKRKNKSSLQTKGVMKGNVTRTHQVPGLRQKNVI